MASVGWLRSLSMFSIGCRTRIHLLGLPFLVFSVRIKCEYVIRKFREMRDEINSCMCMCKCKCKCGCFNTRETSSLPVREKDWLEKCGCRISLGGSLRKIRGYRIFMQMSDRNLITRSSIIYGFAQN
ncbi:hypothetical protein J1N35_043349 [Gossypium stocksii]|uniref:Uncharacterized protein n=1 Tax=Gossypium stocksii TaxID=47602 RepID=A0A9D3ZF00_9ROSI|nr:hypothetical protein J1N35_043349 [Gossypium stocksii]